MLLHNQKERVNGVMDFKTINVLKTTLDNHRPLPEPLLKGLKQDFFIKNTYHSNAIEGNTLTLYETKAVLEDGVTIAGKSLREHYEVTNHKAALEFIEDMVHNDVPLNERTIRDIHSTILHGIDNTMAGRYRSYDVIISGANHQPPASFHVPDEMSDLMTWYKQDAEQLHTIARAACLHSRFVNSHPFGDGNGRTSRLLMNIELMKDGYPPITIEKDDRSTYYEVLDEACMNQNYEPFIHFVAQRVEQTLSQYVRFVENHQSEHNPQISDTENQQLSLDLDGLDTKPSELDQ